MNTLAEQHAFRHGGRLDGQVIGKRCLVGTRRAFIAQTHTKPQRWAAAGVGSGVFDGDTFRTQDGDSMGGFSPRDGLLRHDIMEPSARLEKSRCLAEIARVAVGQTTQIRPDRLLACHRRFVERACSAWWKKTGPNPTDRRKKGTKHHIITDGQGTPLVATITGANRHDVTQLLPLVDAIPPIAGKVGAPLRVPASLLADRAYDSAMHRQQLRERGIAPMIAKRRTNHGSGLGVLRCVVEQTISLFHQFRRLRTRFDKRDDIHEAFLSLGCSVICWRRLNHGYF